MSKPGNSVSVGRASDAGLLSISNSRRWVLVGLLFVASFINYLDRATISVALPLISVDLHLGPETKGLVLSSFFWSYALMQIPVGWCVGPMESPLALRRALCHLVARLRIDGLRRQPAGLDSAANPAGYW